MHQSSKQCCSHPAASCTEGHFNCDRLPKSLFSSYDHVAGLPGSCDSSWARSSPGSFAEPKTQPLGRPVSHIDLTRFCILQETVAPSCWFPGERYEAQNHQWSLWKATICSIRLSCLRWLQFPSFSLIPGAVNDVRAACCLRGFVGFKSLTSSRKYWLSFP